MKPGREKYYRFLFTVSAIYDTALGIIFTFFSRQAFQMLGIAHKLPEFGGYISLLGAFLFVIGAAYFLIARGDLRRNLDLILVGVLYKLAYCATAFSYFAIGEVPHIIFVSLFGVADFIFLVLMIECFLFLKKTASSLPLHAGTQ